jgi:hypothetical protein
MKLDVPGTERLRMPRRVLVLAVAALIVLTGSGGSCSEGRHEPTTPAVPDVQPAALGAPDLRVVVLTDLKGYLEPCGCTSHPLGGLDRLAAQMTALRADGAPTVFVAAGNLFNDADRHGVDPTLAATQEEWRAQTVASALSSIGLSAATLGPADLRDGAARLGALAAASHFAFVASGASVMGPAESAMVHDHFVVTAGARHVGIIGVSAWEASDLVRVPSDPQAALTAAATAARAEGADVVIALIDGTRRDARRFASSLDGVALVVAGGVEEDEAHPPAANGAIVASAGQQGQGVAVIELYGLASGGEWTDASIWSRTEERDRNVRDATALRARIAEWERDGTSAADIATQRERLAGMERDIAAAARAPEVHGRAFVARYVSLPDTAPRDASVQAMLDDYSRRVNDHNRTALAGVLPPPLGEGQAGYVGTTRCGECHAEERTWWLTTLHGHAYQTLVDVHKEYNLSCVGCHVTGYNRPGGSTVAHVGEHGELQDVGCENCHGPGSLHASDPTTGRIARDMGEDTCLRCHTPEHSDRFVYEAYRRMMIAPGHGMPSEG